jgi:hypothetical protein
MSNVARGSDSKLHYADDFKDNYRGEFVCPNENCGAILTLKNLGTDLKYRKRISPYFSARPKAPHAEGCEYASGSIAGNDLVASGFSLDEYFSHILQPTAGKVLNGEQSRLNPSIALNEDSERRINTVNALYRFCFSHSDEYMFHNDKKIWQIYQEKRNEKYGYPRNKDRLIKLNFVNCNWKMNKHYNCRTIWCHLPHDEEHCPPAVRFTLGFENTKAGHFLMHDICSILTPLKQELKDANNGIDTPLPIVVCGEWHGTFAWVKSKRQIWVPKTK